MIRRFKYRLYPTRTQVDALDRQLAEACRLYNAAIQERRDAWRISRKSVNVFEQGKQLKEIRAAGDVGIPNYQVCKDVLRRVDRAFTYFFRRLKEGKKAGFPRFKSSKRFDSINFTSWENGCRLQDNGKLYLQGVGQVKIKFHRPIAGKIKTLTIKREAGRWFASFCLEVEAKALPPSSAAIGVDLGINSFATFSDGREVENPRHYIKSQAKLRKAWRKVNRRKKGSNRRLKAARVLARVYAHIKNQRADFHHKVARALVNSYGVIVVEDLWVDGLARNTFIAKHIYDAGWSSFIIKLASKAEEAARELVKVNPHNTSQQCLCGADVPKSLKMRWHTCPACGLSAPRDIVSAQLILARGLRVRASTCPVRESVA